jgi:hypothetical protein
MHVGPGVLAIGLAVLLAGCAPSQAASSAASRQPQGRNGAQAGSRLLVQLDQPIGLDESHVGERLSGHLVQRVVDAHGQVLIPAGAPLFGHVADIRTGSGIGQPASISIAFDEIDVRGQRLPIDARVVGADPAAPQHGVDPRNIVGSGVPGGALGAILGQSTGAVAGSAAGAGAGTVISLGMNMQNNQLPAGTALALELERPLPLEVRPAQPGGLQPLSYPNYSY